MMRLSPSRPIRSRRWPLALLLCCALPGRDAAAARPIEPAIRIALDQLGYGPLPTHFFAPGSTLFTVHFVDETHLLFTYHTRRLMSRLPDDDPEDADRTIAAVLLELPSGRVLARTEWRTHDHRQYLWPVAHGRFLLRIGTRIALLDPLRDLRDGDAFHEHAFFDGHRPIGHVEVSPGGEMLTVETLPPPKRKLTGGAASAAALAATQPGSAKTVPGLQRRDERSGQQPRTDVQLRFFRLVTDEPGPTTTVAAAQRAASDRLTVRSAGGLRAETLISLPLLSEGYLDMKRESKSVYLFDFQSFAGKRLELSPFDTTCQPRAQFVSRTDFIALGCRGHEGYEELSGFNLHGAEDWIQVLGQGHGAFTVAAAPLAGRFALSSVVSASGDLPVENMLPEQMTGQEIAVMQSYDGRVLLRVQATPIQIAGQNFDLSADGLSLAMLHGSTLEVYRLPGLTSRDQKQLKLAESYAPERTDSVVKLSGGAERRDVALDSAQEMDPAAVHGAEPVSAPAPATPGASPTPGTPAPTREPPSPPVEEPVRRVPPSLYSPGDPEPAKSPPAPRS